MVDTVATASRMQTADAVVRELTGRIMDGRLEPGTHLREVELAEELRVSRQSLRMALAELVHLGLAIREPNRGIWVRTLTRRDFLDINFMRGVIEGEAVLRAASNPAGWPRIGAAIEQLQRLPDGTRWSEVVQADTAVHEATVIAADSPRLARAYEPLVAELRLSLVPVRLYMSVSELAADHAELFRAIESGDGPTAKRRFMRHLALSSDSIAEALPE